MVNYWLGKKIRLRGIEPGDADTLFQWNQDSQRAMHLDFLWPPSTHEDVKTYAETESKKKLEEDRFAFMIETLEGIPVGTISTHNCQPRHGTFSYGIDIAEQHRRHGFAREAILLVIRYYFDHLRYQKVTVNIHANNPVSISLHRNLGFTEEGKLRNMCYQNGKYLDEYYFGMTIDEFHQKYGRS